MKILEATKTTTATTLTVHIDESRTIEIPAEQPALDAEAAAPELDATVDFVTVPDPEFVIQLQWGNDVPEAVVLRETALLAAFEAGRRGGGAALEHLQGVALAASPKH